MYKVFINDSLICLSDNCDILTENKPVQFEESKITFWIELLEQTPNQELYLLCEDLERSWQTFRNALEVKSAAGGKVINSKGEVLFIKRFGKWDLPKGHLENGETKEAGAIREVEEECGIKGLQIVSKLPTTYHIFRSKETLILKETFWFQMSTAYNGSLVPQLEEDITEVHFFDAENTSRALHNTYKNILLLFDN